MSLPYCDENELIRLGLSEVTARGIARVVNRDDYVPLQGSGDPITNGVKSNKSRFYIDVTGPTLYYNIEYENDTDWTAI